MIKKNRPIVDKKSVRFQFWKYFISFAILVLIILWLLQTVFFNEYYTSMKVREIEKLGNKIMADFEVLSAEEFYSNLFWIGLSKGVNIEVYGGDRKKISAYSEGANIVDPDIYMPRNQFKRYFGDLDEKNSTKTFTEKYFGLDKLIVVYTGLIGEKNGEVYYIAITTALDTVEFAVDIIKNQLVVFSFISLALALIISFFLSNRLARPLVKMSKTAKELAFGDYNVQFEKGEYSEINDLASALNHATDELTKTIEMRKDLIANVSHDLKTPLTVIKSYGEMIRDISGSNESLRNRHIETIISEADNLTRLVNDLLDLSKVESELEDIKKIPFNLKSTAELVLKRFQILSEQEGYHFSLEVEGDPTILGDEAKINQVLYNFISNGINNSKDRKEIKIRIISNDEKTICEVIDYGVGIEEDKKKYIWDRYYQVRDNYSRPVIGTGLGLYIVKNILELHGFEYGVHSTVGEGSTFYFIAKK